jgi:hypothetical protein
LYDHDDSAIKEYSSLVAAEGLDSTLLTPLEDYMGTKAVKDMLQNIPECHDKNPPSTESSFLP